MILVYSFFFLLRYIRGESVSDEENAEILNEVHEEIFVKSADDFACVAAMIAHTFHYLRVCF